VWARDLEFADVFWAVAFVPPDRIAPSTHVHGLWFLDSDCIRTTLTDSDGLNGPELNDHEWQPCI